MIGQQENNRTLYHQHYDLIEKSVIFCKIQMHIRIILEFFEKYSLVPEENTILILFSICSFRKLQRFVLVFSSSYIYSGKLTDTSVFITIIILHIYSLALQLLFFLICISPIILLSFLISGLG